MWDQLFALSEEILKIETKKYTLVLKSFNNCKADTKILNL